jgi:hypothetical protein
MRYTRALVSLLVLPAVALLFAACGGGGGVTSNVVPQNANIRFVNAAPGAAGAANNLDIYFTATNSTASTMPLFTNIAYGNITNFGTQLAHNSATVTLRPGNSTNTTAPLGTCSIPQLSANNNYTIVIVNNTFNANGSITCSLFDDLNYTAPGQFRFHDASPAGATTIGSFGTTNGTTVTSFTVIGAAAFQSTVQQNPQGGFATVTPVTGITSGVPVGFAVGATATAGTVEAPIVQMTASQLVAPGATTQPDTANTLPGGGFNNASIFAVDCTGATTPQGTACASGVALIGTLDSR